MMQFINWSAGVESGFRSLDNSVSLLKSLNTPTFAGEGEQREQLFLRTAMVIANCQEVETGSF
ncbi:hypothetical protein AM228_21850 [Planktothricoides sp. SR001]|nr:hypothetical protein AM228_21850 [Planktothricoides sp. SR001]